MKQILIKLIFWKFLDLKWRKISSESLQSLYLISFSSLLIRLFEETSKKYILLWIDTLFRFYFEDKLFQKLLHFNVISQNLFSFELLITVDFKTEICFTAHYWFLSWKISALGSLGVGIESIIFSLLGPLTGPRAIKVLKPLAYNIWLSLKDYVIVKSTCFQIFRKKQ